MTKEQKFYGILSDIFVGAKVEGESGYINLMRIKSRYYEKGVFPKLSEDVNKAIEPFLDSKDFKEELFDKLYTFFSRYFSESGSIYFRHTPLHQNVYEKVYTDDKDVILFWKTHMLYYVKTDRLFKNLEVEMDGTKFFFDVSTLEHKRANEKREIIYEFKEKRKDGVFVFNVNYSERGRKTKIVEVLKVLKKEEVKITEDILESAFRVFEKQSEVDYFINRNAKEFLKEQFNIWLYQYVFAGESKWTEKRIKQLQVLNGIAFKIIDFISQFEDELVRIWNKPKFVLNSNYVITLDRIAKKSIDVVEKILNHKNLDDQIMEWQNLGIIDDGFDKSNVMESTLADKQLKKGYQHLPIDTKYFKDLELKILELFDDLDNALDGWLIKSENYQALNTILPKFREKVQTIYIDPPFNKEQDADYFYSVKYKDASWITLLENRLQLAKDVLKDTGSIFVRCDYNGNMYVRMLMNEIFGGENFRNEIIVKRGYVPKGMTNQYLSGTDYLLFYARNKEKLLFAGAKKRIKEEQRKWISLDMPGQRKTYELQVRYFFGKPWLPPKGQHWGLPQRKIDEYTKLGWIRINPNRSYMDTQDNRVQGMPEYLKEPELLLDTNWTDIKSYETHNTFFPTENSEVLLKRVIEGNFNESELILDFFLGSGTTTAVAHKLKRKWLGVEMGEHFCSFLPENGKLSGVINRMKEVLAGRGNHEPCGISKEVNWQGGGFFKYYELEQYEDTLRKVKYEDSDLFENPYQDPYNQYIFMKDLKFLEALEIDYKNNKVKVDLSKLYENIDIPETLSNLLGKRIRKISTGYVEFEDGEKIDIKNLDYRLIKSLIWW